MSIRSLFVGGVALSLLGAAPASAAPVGFEAPAFAAGSVNGQNGWGFPGNSPTLGTVAPIPGGSPAFLGSQALNLTTTSNPGLFGVANGVYSNRGTPAGETGSSSAFGPAGGNQWQASLYYRTPAQGAFAPNQVVAQLNPAFWNGAVADRYAYAALETTANGSFAFFIDWPTQGAYDAGDFAQVAAAQPETWYRLDYAIRFVDGLNPDGTPNDVFTFSVFDLAGGLLGSATGSTWETLWRSAGFGGVPRAVDGFDFLNRFGPASANLGYVDNVSFVTTPEPATLLLLGAGVVGLAVARRRRS